jgi:hypothetical protein
MNQLGLRVLAIERGRQVPYLSFLEAWQKMGELHGLFQLRDFTKAVVSITFRHLCLLLNDRVGVGVRSLSLFRWPLDEIGKTSF